MKILSVKTDREPGQVEAGGGSRTGNTSGVGQENEVDCHVFQR